MSKHKDCEVLFFPIVNEGFTVHDEESYKQLMGVIFQATVELQEDYPEHQIFVMYEVNDES